MKTAGIIAEYNPFHNGHLYLIDQAKKIHGADRIVVIMSGDFVQRGAPACVDKFCRCRMALACGADLVLELPCPGALSSAEGFASSAVSILNNSGIIDFLIFGCEDADPDCLTSIASVLNEEPASYRDALQEALRSGKNYPAARETALSECLSGIPSKTAALEVIRKPNNILAVEYCRALERSASSIRPVPVRRIGGGYHDLNADGEFLSASGIRKALTDCCSMPYMEQSAEIKKLLERTTPPAAAAVLTDHIQHGGILEPQDFSDLIFYALLKEKGNLDTYADVSPQLADRLEEAVLRCSGLEDLVESVCARSYTQTRIRRCLLHILLGHTKDLIAEWKAAGYSGYVNVLGFLRDSKDLFTAIPEAFRAQMVLRSADRRALSSTGSRVSEADLLASELYRSVHAGKYAVSRRPVLSEPVIVI